MAEFYDITKWSEMRKWQHKELHRHFSMIYVDLTGFSKFPQKLLTLHFQLDDVIHVVEGRN